MKIFKIHTAILLSSLLLLSACDSYLDIKPVGSVIPTTAQEYRALMARAYQLVPTERGAVCFRSDEMQVSTDSYDQRLYGDWERWNDAAPSPNTNQLDWGGYYSTIFIANHVIENQHNITEGTPDVVNQLVGEAYLLRAYMHFILVNLHGQPYTREGALSTKAIPLKLNNDLEVFLTQNTVEEVYTSILSDISHARELMTKESWEVEFSYRFTSLTVDAMESRTFLYMGEWQNALNASEALLRKKSSLEDLNADSPLLPNHFKSVESITALEYMRSNVNNANRVPKAFLALYDEGDLRLSFYFSPANEDGEVKSLKGGKNEFACSFRIGEMYLNAAEAAANLNKLPEARTRLLQLMQKRYTPEAYATKEAAINTMNQQELVKEILDERARELAYEGHRWFDLRRTTRPRIEKILDGKSYVLEQDDARYTLPIPKDAIAANPGLAN